MFQKRKRSPATVGTVLHKIKDPAGLKPWADYMAGIDPWKSLEISADKLLEGWSRADRPLQFFSAADPRSAKLPGFEHEHGLIVFTADGGRGIVEDMLRGSLAPELAEGGYIQAISTKVRHKGIGKYLVAAAERVISEKHPRVFLFVSETNHAAQRFYKSLGYEEVGRARDCIRQGNTEILMTKVLSE